MVGWLISLSHASELLQLGADHIVAMGSAPSKGEVVKRPRMVDSAAFVMTDDAGAVRDATNDHISQLHRPRKTGNFRQSASTMKAAELRLALQQAEIDERERIVRIETAIYRASFDDRNLTPLEEELDAERRTALLQMAFKYGFKRWRAHHAFNIAQANHYKEVAEQAAQHTPHAKMFSGFFRWVEFMMLLQKATMEADRRCIETAIAVSELENVWDMALADYPQPNSSADCDDCGRQNCFRYYHIEHRPDENFAEGGGLDLCERCFVGGEIAAEMDPDLFNSFDLVAPLIRAREAWQDIRDREKALMQVAFQEKAAQLAQQRSEAQMAGRLFVGAAEAAKGNERVLVEARFAGASQQASVPRGSRAAILGARSPEQLGEEIMSIIAELRGAAQLSTLLLEVKDRLMVAAVVESSTSVQEKEAESGPLYQMLKSIGVGIAPRRAPPPPPPPGPPPPAALRGPSSKSIAETRLTVVAPPTTTPMPPKTPDVPSSPRHPPSSPNIPTLADSAVVGAAAEVMKRVGGAEATQQRAAPMQSGAPLAELIRAPPAEAIPAPRPLGTAMPITAAALRAHSTRPLGAPMTLRAAAIASQALTQRAAAAPTRSSQGQSTMETIFLLRQIDQAVAQMGIPAGQRKQIQVQFAEGAPTMPISVPFGCRAAALEPAPLGMLLLQATRKAPSLNAARAALEALLKPLPGEMDVEEQVNEG